MSEPERIFICEECNYIFNEDEKQVSDEEKQWGHPCKAHPRSYKPYRCESYLKEYVEVPLTERAKGEGSK